MIREVAERSVGLGPVKAMTRRNKAAKAKAEKPAIDSNDKAGAPVSLRMRFLVDSRSRRKR